MMESEINPTSQNFNQPGGAPELQPEAQPQAAVYPVPPQPVQKPLDWLSVLQVAFSLFAAFACWLGALLFLFSGFLILTGQSKTTSDPNSPFLIAAGAVLSGFLMLVPAWLAFTKVINRPAQLPAWYFGFFETLANPVIVVVILIPVLAVGGVISRNTSISWLLLPPLQVLGIGLPVLSFLYLGISNLPKGSLQRSWGVFSVGLILSPAIILFLEIIAMVIVGIALFLYLYLQPDLFYQVKQAFQMITSLPENASQDRVITELEPLLKQPVIVLTILGFISGIVPLIEEIFKPLGVWLLVNRRPSPAEGFAAGLLSGAGYALFENLALSASGGDWVSAVVARIGAGLLHIITAGISGYALAEAWTHRRYLRLGLVYLVVVFIHGLWNSLGLALAFVPSNLPDLSKLSFTDITVYGASFALVIFAIIMLLVMLGFNRAFRAQSSTLAAQNLTVENSE